MFRWTIAAETELRLLERIHAQRLWERVDGDREHLGRFLPWVDRTASVADVSAFIESALAQFAAGNGFHAGIWHQGDLAGCAGMHPIDHANSQVSLGYWVSSEYQGKGLVTAAARALTTYCLDELGLHRVVIECSVHNDKSRKVAERLGFQHEGIRRQAQRLTGGFTDLHVYSLLATDPRTPCPEMQT